VRQFQDAEKHRYATDEEQKIRGPNTRVFLNESLAPERRQLLADVRRKVREISTAKGRKYKFIWTHQGEIRVRKDEQSPIIKINSQSDINYIK
jgi:hypothetical protein